MIDAPLLLGVLTNILIILVVVNNNPRVNHTITDPPSPVPCDVDTLTDWCYRSNQTINIDDCECNPDNSNISSPYNTDFPDVTINCSKQAIKQNNNSTRTKPRYNCNHLIHLCYSLLILVTILTIGLLYTIIKLTLSENQIQGEPEERPMHIAPTNDSMNNFLRYLDSTA